MTQDRMTTPYPPFRIALHWLSAAVVLWATITGFLVASQPAGGAFRRSIDLINPQVTTLFIPFFAWRLALFLRSRPWRGWTQLALGKRAALIGHGLLYFAVTMVLLTGFLMMPAPWHLLGLLPMPSPLQNTGWLAPMHAVHRLCCRVLALLVLGHLAAVAAHHGAGDPVLRRMRPLGACPRGGERGVSPGQMRPFDRASL